MVVAGIAEGVIGWMGAGGYPVLFVLMMFESMVVPIPSEIVMPFAGFLLAKGTFTWAGVVIFSSLGSLVGSLLSYWIGLYGGRSFLLKWGKYVLLDKEHLIKTEKWFKRRGSITIFISRFIPVVRHLISIPAGMAKMNIWLFMFYTLIGATIWNLILVYIGIVLNQQWHVVTSYTGIIDIIVLGILVLFVVWFVYKQIKVRKYRS